MLPERASGHGKDLLVVFRFVFRRVSHRQKSTTVLYKCQEQKIDLARLAEIGSGEESCEA
jgi:hypothetical protein